MEKDYSHISERLAGYFLGDLTAEQTSEINDRIAASEEKRFYFTSVWDITGEIVTGKQY
jgi:hypothetical protein